MSSEVSDLVEDAGACAQYLDSYSNIVARHMYNGERPTGIWQIERAARLLRTFAEREITPSKGQAVVPEDAFEAFMDAIEPAVLAWCERDGRTIKGTGKWRDIAKDDPEQFQQMRAIVQPGIDAVVALSPAPSVVPDALREAHGVAWSDDRLGVAYQLLDEAYQEWPSESGPGEAIRAARDAIEAADMELPE